MQTALGVVTVVVLFFIAVGLEWVRITYLGGC